MKFLIPFILVLGVSTTHASELEKLGWLAGHWVSPDGAAEEVWLEPKGGTMSGSFRWVFPNGNVVLEYMVIEQTEDGITFRFKHYNPNFEPWEKGEPNTYRVIAIEDHSVSFERVSENDKAPLKYRYSRQDDMLEFMGEGDSGEDPLVLRFHIRK